jgi:hypothetical protein
MTTIGPNAAGIASARRISKTWPRMRRFVRKHRFAIAALVAFHFVLFFPTLFMGRVLSTNDVFYHYEPWMTASPIEAQNPTLDAASTGILTVLSLVKNEPSALHWNPYIGSGIPGFGSSVVLSPFMLLPALLLPLFLLYTGIIAAKLNFSFVFAYVWLREERMGKRGAAIGAITFAGAGIYSVWWLLHPTNATALYPAFLYLAARIAKGKRVSIVLTALVALFAIMAGFPAMIAYGAWLTLFYFAFRLIRERKLPVREISRASIGVILGLLVSAPFFFSFVSFLERTGYLTARLATAVQNVYPLDHFRSFIFPFRLGDPASHLWIGDARLGYSNDFVEATVYVGLLAIPLLVVGLFRRRSSSRWFFLAATAIVLLVVFGPLAVREIAGRVPGLRYSPLTRLRVLLPIGASYLAASGMALFVAAWRRTPLRKMMVIPVGVAVLFTAIDLSLFAARFYPYLTPKVATPPRSETIEFLKSQPRPFRVAPFFTFAYPNTAELIRLEDVRSHFSSEAEYRKLMLRVDPGAWDSPTLILFNSLKTRLADPLFSFLNVRYFVEQRNIDIVRWSIFEHTKLDVPDRGVLPLEPGDVLRRTVIAGNEPFYALELTATFQSATAPDAKLVVTLIRPESGAAVFRRVVTAGELQRMPKIYLPVARFTSPDNALQLVVESHGIKANLIRSDALPGESPLFYGRVTWPIVLTHELSDGRIFENLAQLPRYYPVWLLATMSDDEFLKNDRVDLAHVAVVAEPVNEIASRLAAVSPASRRAKFRVTRYEPAEQVVVTDSPAPFFMATSEKLNRELTVRVDGKRVSPVKINTMFAGVAIDAGKHTVEFRRRVGDGWWIPSGLATIALIGIAIRDRKRR